MPRMIRANSVIHVDKEDVQRYISLGYALTNDSGTKVIKEATPHDATALMRMLTQSNARIAELEQQVATLTAELELTKKKTAGKKTTGKKAAE